MIETLGDSSFAIFAKALINADYNVDFMHKYK